ncbi:MAG: MerR family transcriptional regulator, light-induced transcriptional regulator [Thermomicrobiales bacterium]|nr:MerR family transcriptional regulator, light-induced transcriptional regulator [Thermomicrobiales bacterium]
MRLFDRFRSEPVYNTRAVVQRTGVPADTFRAWERRYGLPVPARTAGNQRLYSERDIAVICWLRDQTRAGVTISQAVALFGVEHGDTSGDDADGLSTAHGSWDGSEPATEADGRLGEFRDQIIKALVKFDAATADRAVEEALALVAVDDVCLHVLEAALVEVGDRWRRGEVGTGSEHFASCFVMRKFAALFNLSQPQYGRGPIVAACVEGELHEIGLLLTSLFLSRHGFRVVYLGANLPLCDLLTVVREVRPMLVMLSAATETAVEKLNVAIATLRGAVVERKGLTPAPMIGFGGRIFVDRPELRDEIDALFLGVNARETIECVEQALARDRAGVAG